MLILTAIPGLRLMRIGRGGKSRNNRLDGNRYEAADAACAASWLSISKG